MACWSNIQKLSDYKNAPQEAGIYIIGTRPLGHDCSLPEKVALTWYGANWPEYFIARYVGKSVSPTSSIRDRLSAHARLKGNTNVTRHICEHGIESLFFIYATVPNIEPAIEHMIIVSASNLFDWNKRQELKPLIDFISKDRTEYKEAEQDGAAEEAD